MAEGFPDYLDVDYSDGEGETPEDYPSIQHKIEKAIEVTKQGLEEYGDKISDDKRSKLEDALERLNNELETASADEDITALDGNRVQIVAEPDQYDVISQVMQQAGLNVEASDITKIPENEVAIADLETAQKIQRLLDALDDHDDVTAVHTNFAPTPEVQARRMDLEMDVEPLLDHRLHRMSPPIVPP